MKELDNNIAPYTTFGISANTKGIIPFNSIEELRMALEKCKESEFMILGGGSNVLFTKNYNGYILKNEIKGIKVISEDDQTIIVQSGAGEIWHEFVLHCIDHNWGGIENLSLIPGSVGASPMQNIGAYGVEIKDVFDSLDAYHIESGETHTFNLEQCKFGYRESVFKRELKGQYVITQVRFRLEKDRKINTKYGIIEQQLSSMGITDPSIKDVSNAVIAIRQSKLPDPKEIGNAGSFFKNPVISGEQFKDLKVKFPEIPNYPAPNNQIKLAAGWLIEQAGWKGYTQGDFGVHKKQALVLVNYNSAKGSEILGLSDHIIADIKQKFGVELEREVNII